MTTYQVLAAYGHERDTIHVEQRGDEFFPLNRSVLIDGEYLKCEVIGFVEADDADAAHDAACAEFLR